PVRRSRPFPPLVVNMPPIALRIIVAIVLTAGVIPPASAQGESPRADAARQPCVTEATADGDSNRCWWLPDRAGHGKRGQALGPLTPPEPEPVSPPPEQPLTLVEE